MLSVKKKRRTITFGGGSGLTCAGARFVLSDADEEGWGEDIPVVFRSDSFDGCRMIDIY